MRNPMDSEVNNTLPTIGLQLYTVRDALSQNPSATLKELSEIGYKYVEIADTSNYPLSQFTSLLSEYNLSALSTHIDYLVLLQSSEYIIQEIKKSGLKYVVVPWIGPEVWQDVSLAENVISAMDNIGKSFADEGIFLCYHNHAHEIRKTTEIGVLDLLLERAEKVYLELDLGWGYVATGENPFKLVEKYGHRIKLFHLKDVSKRDPVKFTELGMGEIPWVEILPEIWKLNKSPWIVEQDDNFSINSISSAKVGIETLRAILKRL
ncbi:MAG: sugar phosphate isomerase/epimerase [Candidatus Hydrogenedentes bacterium]|nr:sugar phosphate isomerase/epimerase [Candidatus Hydrogenedentota bacterium]